MNTTTNDYNSVHLYGFFQSGGYIVCGVGDSINSAAIDAMNTCIHKDHPLILGQVQPATRVVKCRFTVDEVKAMYDNGEEFSLLGDVLLPIRL